MANMLKKPGQISANTLSLRFMQNAARAKQEKEAEAAKAKVKSQEEWELPPNLRLGWNNNNDAAEKQGAVTYEQSYLPFLFPKHPMAAPVTNAGTSGHPELSEDHDSFKEDSPQLLMKGRRKFGKRGKEEIKESPPDPPQALPSTSGTHSLPRGARAISSHGRSAASSSTSSNQVHSPPVTQRPVEKLITSKSSTTQGPPVFMKPQVDVPRAAGGERTKRSSAYLSDTQDGLSKKKKKWKHEEV